VRVWDVASRKLLHALRPRDSQVFFAAFTPDGKRLVASDGGSLTFWDVTTGAPCHNDGHTYCVAAIAFAPGGKSVVTAAASTDPLIGVWDVRTGKEQAAWRGHVYGIGGMAVSGDGRLVASGSWDETIRLWDFATGTEVRRIDSHRGAVTGVAFSPTARPLP